MKLTVAVIVLAATLPMSTALASDWKKELAAPLVTISKGKMVFEELQLCSAPAGTGAEASSFQVKTRSEAPNNKFISRDNFVAITAAISMSIVEQFGELECKDLETPIGTADHEITILMAEGGMQVEVTNTGTGQKNRNTVRWEDMFAE
jgi:hypothetical protein